MAGGWHRVAIAYNTRPAPVGDVTLAEVQDAVDIRGPRGARVVKIGDRSRFVINQRTVEKQSVGRIFLAGDAAHVNSAMGAQGLDVGVQDSFNPGVETGRGDQRQLVCEPARHLRRRASARR